MFRRLIDPRTHRSLVADIVLGCVASLSAAVSMAHAQAPGAEATIMPRCTVLLAPDRVASVLGAGAVARPAAQRPGETHVVDCAWGKGSANSVTAQWFDRAAIQSSSVSRTFEGYADMLLTAGEEAAGKPREAVAGLGARAAMVHGQSAVLLVVQRPDGVVRALASGLTRAQLLALAKALATTE